MAEAAAAQQAYLYHSTLCYRLSKKSLPQLGKKSKRDEERQSHACHAGHRFRSRGRDRTRLKRCREKYVSSKQPNKYCKTASEQSAHIPTVREAGQEYSQRAGGKRC